ncbi:hypothetical protein VKT23_005909 [Stygiomarasmius scandens]|uniref:Transcription factor CBF/NF-Y/archaeal histone domain-containing protein n=1 Tax=Marasmiellus scandens TaxID=2682957 RepID=A0ABR1JS20_9AGAR
MADNETPEEVFDNAEVDNAENEEDIGVDEGAEPSVSTKKRRDNALSAREPGKSLLPFTRVQKIVKADKDIPIMARDATFLISLATEEFIKRLTQAGQRLAEKEKRSTVQNKDLVSIVRKVDEFLFLEEIISSSESNPKRVPKAAAPKNAEPPSTSGPTLLDQFVKKPEADQTQVQDIVANEDGTMESTAGAESQEGS